jgi:hypothetical protein
MAAPGVAGAHARGHWVLRRGAVVIGVMAVFVIVPGVGGVELGGGGGDLCRAAGQGRDPRIEGLHVAFKASGLSLSGSTDTNSTPCPPVISGRPMRKKMLSTASEIRLSLVSRPAFFTPYLASRSLPDASGGPCWPCNAKWQAALSGREPKARSDRRCSNTSPTHRPIGALPEQPGVTRRRYRIQDLPKLGDVKSGADHPAPNRIAASRLEVPCRQSLPALPARPHSARRSLQRPLISTRSRPNLTEGRLFRYRDAKFYGGQNSFACGDTSTFQPEFCPFSEAGVVVTGTIHIMDRNTRRRLSTGALIGADL